jgi:hypothetical protein
MPTVRRAVVPRSARLVITDDIIKIWRTIRRLGLRPEDKRRQEYYTAQRQLMLLVYGRGHDPGLSPPNHSADPIPPAYLYTISAERMQDYLNAHRLFCLLEKAVNGHARPPQA